MTSKGRRLVASELGRRLKAPVVTSLAILSKPLTGKTDDCYEKRLPLQQVSGPVFEVDISWSLILPFRPMRSVTD